jgi:hypothetical protein
MFGQEFAGRSPFFISKFRTLYATKFRIEIPRTFIPLGIIKVLQLATTIDELGYLHLSIPT